MARDDSRHREGMARSIKVPKRPSLRGSQARAKTWKLQPEDPSPPVVKGLWDAAMSTFNFKAGRSYRSREQVARGPQDS